ncbi:MAG: type II secretion system F family protein [Micromonosporaceae bacterium]|nr:type II secretion system F family protein [Micromonosporaceae bacterium]
MTLTVPLAALLGLGTGLGLVLLVLGLIGRQDAPGNLDVSLGAESSWSSRILAHGSADRRRLLFCLAVAAFVGLVTRWPVAAALCGAGAWVLPAIIGPDRGHARRVARIEAIATWTESLRDNLTAAAGLEQSILASAIEAPEPIRDEVTGLAIRLRRGWRLSEALRHFAADLADPTADLVVAGLLLAAKGAAGQLGDTLGELAESARAKVASRQRIAASRATNRTSARVIVGATLAMAVFLVVANRGYLRPFDTPIGQLVLVAAGGCFAGAFAWLGRLMRDRDASRILAQVAAEPSTAGAVES